MVGMAVSFGVFAAIRSFAKGTPATMTKEYQEASNEYMKVRLRHSRIRLRETQCSHWGLYGVYQIEERLTDITGTKDRATHWCLLR